MLNLENPFFYHKNRKLGLSVTATTGMAWHPGDKELFMIPYRNFSRWVLCSSTKRSGSISENTVFSMFKEYTKIFS